MSRLHNQVVSTWEVIESRFRCVTLRYQGEVLDAGDLGRFRDAYVLFILALDDLLTVPGDLPLQWPYKRYIHTLQGLDVAEVMRSFKGADELLLSVYHGGTAITSYDDFKHRLKFSHSRGGALIAPLKELVTAWSLQPGDCHVFWMLHTAFTFISRIRFERCETLEKAALQDYLVREATFPSIFTIEEGGFFAQWFPDTQDLRDRLYKSHVGCHGPGMVAENIGRDFVKKYDHLGYDSLTDYLDQIIGCDPVPWERPSFRRTSRVIFVPKTALKLRTICAEPATLQWYEQGFRSALYDFIATTGLRNRIDLRDQSANRALAREGSITGDLATIDLSAASDSVAYEMVRQWTYNTALSPMVLACRSTHAELPDGRIVELNKFAPMGSALCFPFECLIFCSIVEAAITEIGDRYQFSRYRVYGDDIVVERRYVDAVIRRLEANGFTVNSDKSFFHADTNIYRESCGGEYLNGEDVSPVRLARHFNGWSNGLSTSSDIERLVDLCNTCYGLLPSVRGFVVRKLISLPKPYRPLFSDNANLIGLHIPFSDRCQGVYSPSASNYHLNSQWNGDLQKRQYQTHGSVSKAVDDAASDGEKLVYEYLRSTRDRVSLDPEDRMDVRNRRKGRSRLGSRWT